MHTSKMKSGVIFHHNGGYEGDVLVTTPDAHQPERGVQTVRVDFSDIKSLVAA